MLFLIFTAVNNSFGDDLTTKDSCTSFSTQTLQDLPTSASTGEKPQSKLWFHDNTWWAVLPNINGTELWQLADTSWVSVLHLSDSSNIMSDVLAIGNVTHILLFNSCESELISVEYDLKNKKYQPWLKRPKKVSIELEQNSETATITLFYLGHA